jgi:hypothetical protein
MTANPLAMILNQFKVVENPLPMILNQFKVVENPLPMILNPFKMAANGLKKKNPSLAAKGFLYFKKNKSSI